MGLQDRLGRSRGGGEPAPSTPPPAPPNAAGNGAAGHTADLGVPRGEGLQAATGQPTRAPKHDRTTELRRRIHQGLVRALGPQLYEEDIDQAELERRIRDELRKALDEESTPLSSSERQRLVSETLDDILGNGPIEPYLRDPTVTEVMVNQFDAVYIERDGKLQRTPTHFLDDAHLRRTIEKIVGRVGRRIDEAQPYVDARLPDGSRVNAIIPPVSVDGPAITIRKFSQDPYTMADLVVFGSISEQAATFLERCVEGRMNVVVSGGTGAGKTTTLNALSGYIPADERIVTIEDAAELKLQQPHIVRLEYRPANIEGRGEVTIRDLVRNALRMRPDRIVVGEVRGGEALDMLQAMNTGHDGSITTVHANSPRDVLSRLETMVLMAGVDLPVRAIREQVAAGIQLIAHQARLRDGSRRITHVTEVAGMEGQVVTLQDVFTFDYTAGLDADGRFLGTQRPTGIRPHFVERLEHYGIHIPAAVFGAPLESIAPNGRTRSSR
jgi:pilus assembly protein CpaF